MKPRSVYNILYITFNSDSFNQSGLYSINSALFSLISSDGYITSFELTKLMISYTEKITGERSWPDDVAEDVNDMIREADIDGDGKVTFEEFIFMMKSK